VFISGSSTEINSPLHVGGSLMGQLNGDNAPLFKVVSGASTSTRSGIAIKDSWNGTNNNNSYIYFFVGTGSGEREAIRVINNGNVGIGTSSPSGRLHISGDTYATSRIYLQRTTLDASGIYSLGVQGGDNNFGIVDEAQGNLTRFFISSSGNVGIGTTSPSAKLDVNGSIKFSNILTTDYSISFSGIGAGAWYNIPEVNLSGFHGLATITIQNNDPNYGYTVRASAWIFQTGINGEGIYGSLRSVTIRPDGTSQEGFNVVESYHTAPSSGRYNMRMRLIVREASLGAENPLNLQIWVDRTNAFPASGTLSLRAI
jgi:hypothetical protein